MEWLKNQISLARSGEKSARKKLVFTFSLALIAIVLLVSGQVQTPQVTVSKKGGVATPSGTLLYVHIAGGVKNPGVYPIHPGMRLFEVVALAGGFLPNADQASINLARIVADGELILVTKAGNINQNDASIHMNKATAAEFDTLPGIGPTLAGRIVNWRDTNGGFKSINDLRKVGGIGVKLFASIKDLVSL